MRMRSNMWSLVLLSSILAHIMELQLRYGESVVRIDEIVRICQCFGRGNMSMMRHTDFQRHWRGHLIAATAEPNFFRIHVTPNNEFQSGTFVISIPQTLKHFRTTMGDISRKLPLDENSVPQLGDREMHFICFPGNETSLTISEDLLNSHILINEEVYVVDARSGLASRGGWAAGVRIAEVYSLAPGINRFRDLQNFHSETNHVRMVDTTELLRIANRRQNLMGLTLKAVAQYDLGYKAALDVEIQNGTVIFKGGEHMKLFWDYQRLMNFEYTTTLGKGWPSTLTQNDTRLNGLGEQLMDMEADISISTVSFTPLRREKLFFLPPFGYAETAVFVHFKLVESLPPNLHLLPFSRELWVAMASTFVILIAASAAVAKTIETMNKLSNFAYSLSVFKASSLSQIMICTVGICLCQGGNFDPLHGPIRIITITTAVISTLLYIIYSGSFVVFVSIPRPLPHGYKNLKERGLTIFTSPRMLSYGDNFVEDESDREDLMKNSKALYVGNEDTIQKLMDPSNRLAAILRKDAFYGAATQTTASSTRICRVLELDAKRKSRTPEAMLLRKGSPYRELFSHKTLLLTERGLADLYWRNYMRKLQPPCMKLRQRYYNEIDLKESRFAFLIFCGGSVAAIFTFTLEGFTSRFIFSLPSHLK